MLLQSMLKCKLILILSVLLMLLLPSAINATQFVYRGYQISEVQFQHSYDGQIKHINHEGNMITYSQHNIKYYQKYINDQYKLMDTIFMNELIRQRYVTSATINENSLMIIISIRAMNTQQIYLCTRNDISQNFSKPYLIHEYSTSNLENNYDHKIVINGLFICMLYPNPNSSPNSNNNKQTILQYGKLTITDQNKYKFSMIKSQNLIQKQKMNNNFCWIGPHSNNLYYIYQKQQIVLWQYDRITETKRILEIFTEKIQEIQVKQIDEITTIIAHIASKSNHKSLTLQIYKNKQINQYKSYNLEVTHNYTIQFNKYGNLLFLIDQNNPYIQTYHLQIQQNTLIPSNFAFQQIYVSKETNLLLMKILNIDKNIEQYVYSVKKQLNIGYFDDKVKQNSVRLLQSSESQSSDPTGIIVGVGVIISFCIITIVCAIRRRRQQQQAHQFNNNNPFDTQNNLNQQQIITVNNLSHQNSYPQQNQQYFSNSNNYEQPAHNNPTYPPAYPSTPNNFPTLPPNNNPFVRNNNYNQGPIPNNNPIPQNSPVPIKSSPYLKQQGNTFTQKNKMQQSNIYRNPYAQ